MASLLLELFSEEIPARMQATAGNQLLDSLVGDLIARRVGGDDRQAKAYISPRRIAVIIPDIPKRQPDISGERRGPRADAPDKAIAGFLKSTGLARDQLEERETPKGTFLFATTERKGRPTVEILAEVIPDIIRKFRWPKSMRWGDSDLRWVRPLHRILCLFDGQVVPFEVDGIKAGDRTEGHRFLAPGALTIRDEKNYIKELEGAFVYVDQGCRRTKITFEIAGVTQDTGLQIDVGDALFQEVIGLVEWPVVLMGRFDEAFLEVPPEVLVSEMCQHQKYFPLRDVNTRALANRFLVVANIPDESGAIIAGNERVLTARLADARFFWDQDRRIPLTDRVAALDGIVFHARLGSMGEKAARIGALAEFLAPHIEGCDKDMAVRAATLCKADLVSQMVGEFPDLQGVMGRYYALDQGEPEAVADAIAGHYAPAGPDDDCPSAPVSVAVALADKVDTLVGFFAIGERPTGSRDPFALRRAALGIIRLIRENGLRLALSEVFGEAARLYGKTAGDDCFGLIDFLADRLKVALRGQGVRHDLINAVFATGSEDDLVRLLARVAALAEFLAGDDGANLLIAWRRAANIVRIEGKKDGCVYDGAVDSGALQQAEEKTLFTALEAVVSEAEAAIGGEDFAAAMAAVARLRRPVDDFFNSVTVNCDDKALRINRLRLLSSIGRVLGAVGDFSSIEG